MSDVVQRFGKFFTPTSFEECWAWTGAKCSGGYGRFFLLGKARKASRVAFELANGPIPDGLFVLHRCDNRACVNPSHLYAGTHQQNMDDRNSRGRASGGSMPGEKHPMAKLRDADIQVIVERLARGETQREVAAAFGVSRAVIGSRAARVNHV